jgi:hypothetical protein
MYKLTVGQITQNIMDLNNIFEENSLILVHYTNLGLAIS